MASIRTFAALSSIALITACATAAEPAGSQGAKADEHAGHHPASAASAPAPVAAAPDRMKSMQQMHDKMMSAKTPEARQALMAEHMKAMQDGMQMMKGMHAKGTPADMGQRQARLEERMDMMQMMMDMMMQRLPASGTAPAPK